MRRVCGRRHGRVKASKARGRCTCTAVALRRASTCVAWVEEVVRSGAGEILLTSMDRDGTRDGFDLALTRAVSDAVNVPVIASGGVGTLDHLVDGVLEGGADAVLAASIFHFGEHTVAEAKQVLAARGSRCGRWRHERAATGGAARASSVPSALDTLLRAVGTTPERPLRRPRTEARHVGQAAGRPDLPAAEHRDDRPGSSLKVDAEPVAFARVGSSPRRSRSRSRMSPKPPCRWCSPRASRPTSC